MGASFINYEILREWYLARLRNLARKEQAKTTATPSSLIASDKEAIKALVAGAAKPRIQVTSRKLSPLTLLWIWSGIQAALAGSLMIAKHGVNGLKLYLNATVLAAIPNAATAPDGWLEKGTFFAFYLLPVILIAFLPSKYFWVEVRKGKTVKPKLLDKWFEYPRAEWLLAGTCAGLVLIEAVVVLVAVSQGEVPGPESLSLVPETTENLPTRALVAWNSLLIAAMLALFKRFFSQSAWGMNSLREIEKEITDEPSTKSPEDVQSMVDNLRQAVEELRQREHAIADFSDQVILCLDEKLVIEALSPSVLQQWGYFPYDLLGHDLPSIVFRDDQENLEQTLINAPRTKPIELDARIRRSDNTIVDCHWFVDWSPRYGRFFAACNDITDRMNLERSRRAFIAQLTHDMRSPLSAVNLTLSAMQEHSFGELSQEALRLIGRSRTSLTRVLDLINEILESEKLRSRTHHLDLEAFTIGEICDPIVEELKAITAERKIGFKTSGTDVFVKADRKLFTRVFANIMSNAVSFSPKGAFVEIECSATTDSALIKIKDKGPGIPKDYQQLIFEKFGLAKRRDPTDRVSTGLGLSICRDIVTAHGGMIGVESEEGQGSTFWFTMSRERRTMTRDQRILKDAEEPTA